jgi:hypothetical protein
MNNINDGSNDPPESWTKKRVRRVLSGYTDRYITSQRPSLPQKIPTQLDHQIQPDITFNQPIQPPQPTVTQIEQQIQPDTTLNQPFQSPQVDNEDSDIAQFFNLQDYLNDQNSPSDTVLSTLNDPESNAAESSPSSMTEVPQANSSDQTPPSVTPSQPEPEESPYFFSDGHYYARPTTIAPAYPYLIQHPLSEITFCYATSYGKALPYYSTGRYGNTLWHCGLCSDWRPLVSDGGRSVRTHIRKTHREQKNEMEMQCQECGTIKLNKEGLLRHMRDLHPNTESGLEGLGFSCF